LPFFADLHVHSKFSRATSRDCDLEHLALWAKRKGIYVVATGDFTHPAWWQEIQDKLVAAEPGLWRLRPELEAAVDEQVPAACRRPVRFLLEVEISTIYKKGDKTRKVHHLIYAAELATAGRFREALGRIGNIASDGRPILGLDSRHLLEITLESGPDAYLIPAHIWTPWFSALGSKSGFDAIDDCYGDLASHIFAVETGLSSDPRMNWRVSHLDRFTLVSNSDAHSPPMLGREACLFDLDADHADYFAMRRALETGEGWGGTVEFFPEEGKYHLDGHRACDTRLEPSETLSHGGLCPACGKPVTVGVLHRVEVLADRPLEATPARSTAFRSLVQLPEILAEIHGVGKASRKVAESQQALTHRLGPELEILDQVPLEDVRRVAHPLLAEALERLRRGEVHRESGYDGEYGVIRLFAPGEIVPQLSLISLLGLDLPAPAVKAKKEPAATPGVPAMAPIPRRDPAAVVTLDAEQAAAVDAPPGPLLIVAGPGTGKTRTLTQRLARQIEAGTDPARTLAVTFTRRAADELRERLAALLGERGEQVLVRTFHGLGLEILRHDPAAFGLPAGFRVADGAQAASLLQAHLGGKRADVRRALDTLAIERRRRALGGDVVADAAEPPISVASYRRLLADAGVVDLDDLLALPVEILGAGGEPAEYWRGRFDQVLVDEYQDIDAVQYRLLRLITPPSANLCAIGDPDQAIYGFRGADVGFFLRFREDFPAAAEIALHRNYRSQPTIVEGARQVVLPTSLVADRQMVAAGSLGAAPIVLIEAEDEQAEAAAIAAEIETLLGGLSHQALDSRRVRGEQPVRDQLAFDDIAILYRKSAQAAPIEEALARAGIPFQRRSHEKLTDSAEVRWLLHHLAVLREQGREAASAADWLRLLLREVPRDGDAPTLEALDQAVNLLQPLAHQRGADLEAFLADLATGAEVDTWDPRADRVSLLTLHAAKGLEFPVVFLAGCDDDLLPLRLYPTQIDLAEERRLFFVGMTRAQSHLVLTRARHRHHRGERRPMNPSPFLADLDPSLLERQRTHRKPRERKVEQLGLF
jgi:DNA helicase-2/ATP-dependent DNA helicase PcrA